MSMATHCRAARGSARKTQEITDAAGGVTRIEQQRQPRPDHLERLEQAEVGEEKPQPARQAQDRPLPRGGVQRQGQPARQLPINDK